MFCPSCGLEERQSNQFCRACGTDLRPVRSALERTDNVTTSAVSAREEIGRAFAAKIREIDSASDLKRVAEDVLPEIEKFLESPEEKRLRRLRTGALISSIGLGVAIAFALLSLVIKEEELLMLAGMGTVCFFIGMGFVLNGFLLTVPKKSLADNSSDADSQRQLDGGAVSTSELALPPSTDIFSSVTENTTRHLKEKESIPRG